MTNLTNFKYSLLSIVTSLICQVFSTWYSACHLLAHNLLGMKISVPSVLWILCMHVDQNTTFGED